MRIIQRIKDWIKKMISKLGYLLAGSQAQRKVSQFKAIMFYNSLIFDISLPIGYAPNVDFSDNPTTSPKSTSITSTQSFNNQISTQGAYSNIPDLTNITDGIVTTQGFITLDRTYNLYLHDVPAGNRFPNDNYVPSLGYNRKTEPITLTITSYFLVDNTTDLSKFIDQMFYVRIRNGITKKLFENTSRVAATISRADGTLDNTTQLCYQIKTNLVLTDDEQGALYSQCKGQWNFETNTADYTITNPTTISTYVPIIVELI